MGCLMASKDGVALDAVFARLAGCRVEHYITGFEARKRGYPGVDMKNIEVVGEDPASLTPSD